jgi:hypothetical protein
VSSKILSQILLPPALVHKARFVAQYTWEAGLTEHLA